MTTTRKGPRKAIEKHHRSEEQGRELKDAIKSGEEIAGENLAPKPAGDYAGRSDDPMTRDMRESREKARDLINKPPPEI